MNELRVCPITGKKVIIAKKRAKRFKDVRGPKSFASVYKKSCPFCYGKNLKIKETLRIDWHLLDKHDWDLRGFLNLSPYLEPKKLRIKKDIRGNELFKISVPHGSAEVLVENREHNKQLATMAELELEEIFVAYKNRYEDLLKEWKEVLIFRNYGFFAGQSITHPHSQIIAIGSESPKYKKEKERALNYHKEHKKCLICDLIKKEKEKKVRVVFENEGFITLSPWAPIFPYELLIIPKEHQNNILDFSLDSIAQLARMFKNVFGALHLKLFDPPYNYYFRNYQAFKNEEADSLHWFVRVMPRGVSIAAGFELGTGIESINVVPPEEAAKFLKN